MVFSLKYYIDPENSILLVAAVTPPLSNTSKPTIYMGVNIPTSIHLNIILEIPDLIIGIN